MNFCNIELDTNDLIMYWYQYQDSLGFFVNIQNGLDLIHLKRKQRYLSQNYLLKKNYGEKGPKFGSSMTMICDKYKIRPFCGHLISLTGS